MVRAHRTRIGVGVLACLMPGSTTTRVPPWFHPARYAAGRCVAAAAQVQDADDLSREEALRQIEANTQKIFDPDTSHDERAKLFEENRRLKKEIRLIREKEVLTSQPPPAPGGQPATSRIADEPTPPGPPSDQPAGTPYPGQVRAFAGMAFVWIPPGSFMMGCGKEGIGQPHERPRHRVTLTKGFWLGRTEVTKAQWKRVMGTEPWKIDARHRAWGATDEPNTPVQGVTWSEVQSFIAKLNSRAGGLFRAPDDDATSWRLFRLPTEAEWEYACRAGTTTVYQWGNSPDAGRGWCNAADQTAKETDQAQNLEAFSWSDGYAGLAPVGRFRANAWGLHDMHGNLFELCQDWLGSYPSGPVTDPRGPSTGTQRVIRGASYMHGPRPCRSAARYAIPPDERGDPIRLTTIRLARDAPAVVLDRAEEGPSQPPPPDRPPGDDGVPAVNTEAIAVEGETMQVLGGTGGGTVVQDMRQFPGRWSGDHQLFWVNGQPGDTLHVGLPARVAGRYRLLLQFTMAPDYAIVQLYLDGRKLPGPLDLYHAEVAPSRPIDLGVHDLGAGEHRLAIHITGANARAERKYMVGLDCAFLLPVAVRPAAGRR